MIDDAAYSQVLYHDDLTSHAIGAVRPGLQIIARGMGKYLEVAAPPIQHAPEIFAIAPPGSEHWADTRFRAVVTPLSFESAAPLDSLCGIFARYQHADDYLALVLDRHYQLKLLRRIGGVFQLLATSPLEFCLGQSLTLTLTFEGNTAIGTARPYSGATTVQARFDGAPSGGTFGFITSAKARFGPHTVECVPDELTRIEQRRSAPVGKPPVPLILKRERTVSLQNLVSGSNLVFADINGDGKPEILVAQSSKTIAEAISLTRLTCLTALDLTGKILWQAGVPNPESSADDVAFDGRLPFEVHDLYGDGHPAVVCVFGYDVQVRDGKTGRVLMSAGTPPTFAVDADYKTLTSAFGRPWGDETLNMEVAAIAFCDTQGNGGKREILIKDDLRNLAVLDTESEPVLYSIFRHRGNLGGAPWIGDIDGDGKDEIVCGYSVLDHDGKVLASLPLGGYARAVAMREAQQDDETVQRTAYICAGHEGFIALDVDALIAGAYAGEVPLAARQRVGAPCKMLSANFRPDLAGAQIALLDRADAGRSARLTLLDSDGAQLWTRELRSDVTDIQVLQGPKGGPAHVLLCNGSPEVFNGYGVSRAIDIENTAGIRTCGVVHNYGASGLDALLVWTSSELSVYTPND